MLQEERRAKYGLELKVQDAQRREESMKTEVERNRLRVESKFLI
jgi:hypothetical protein